MRSKSGLTTFFAAAVIIIAFIAGFFAWQNQKLVKEIREKTEPILTPPATVEASATPFLNMTNPAATFCVRMGGKSTIKTAVDGSQSGWCTIDGKVYNEWEYFRDNYESPSPSPTASPSATPCSKCQE